ncbi:hypothetical protein FS837_012299 [Tulasnella sp. UAMH 9824]|nr:hypothetical protein FS837_012299 [Tulasnella sp. UAMH 9824]
MSNTLIKIQQMSSTNDSAARREHPSPLLSIPIELHEYMATFLGTRAILNLIMVNRFLLSIYEAILYRCINICTLPNRSICLLETFELRPDLALLVHTLNIDLRPSVVGTASQPAQTTAASPGGYARIRALGLAKNVRSLGISGLSWLPDERLNAFQEVMSTMELKSLRILEPRPVSDVHHLEHKEEVVANLRRVLQAQPLLTELDLEFRLFKMEVKNGGNDVQFGIQKSDVPSLRTLGIRASTIMPLLTAIGPGQLETLNIYEWKWQHHNMLVSSFSHLAETSQKIRKLCLSMRWTLNLCFWGFDFGQVLKLFPNLESLTITAILSPLLAEEPKRLDANFERVRISLYYDRKLY